VIVAVETTEHLYPSLQIYGMMRMLCVLAVSLASRV